MQGHADGLTLLLKLNNKADHYATSAQKHVHYIPIAPHSMFYMDDYTFFHARDEWIESNIWVFIKQDIARSTAEKLSINNNYRMTTWLYDPMLPPDYCYTKATSAYSILVQL